MQTPALETVQSRIDKSIELLFELDKFLFESDVSERCIVHRWAIHIAHLFPEWDVDCEYNRLHSDIVTEIYKFVPTRELNVKNIDDPFDKATPDIIIHKRGNHPGENLLVIEAKKTHRINYENTPNQAEKDDRDFDIKKLVSYCCTSELKYTYSLFCAFLTKQSEPKIAQKIWNPHKEEDVLPLK